MFNRKTAETFNGLFDAFRPRELKDGGIAIVLQRHLAPAHRHQHPSGMPLAGLEPDDGLRGLVEKYCDTLVAANSSDERQPWLLGLGRRWRRRLHAHNRRRWHHRRWRRPARGGKQRAVARHRQRTQRNCPERVAGVRNRNWGHLGSTIKVEPGSARHHLNLRIVQQCRRSRPGGRADQHGAAEHGAQTRAKAPHSVPFFVPCHWADTPSITRNRPPSPRAAVSGAWTASWSTNR